MNTRLTVESTTISSGAIQDKTRVTTDIRYRKLLTQILLLIRIHKNLRLNIYENINTL